MSGEEQSGSPAGHDAYAAALDRLLDGLEPESGTADAAVAGAQASADLDSLTRALGLIAGALAGEDADAGAATVMAAAASPAQGGATVVELSAWRRARNPRVLAAAAVGLLVIGFGVPIAISTGGGNSEDTAASGEAARALSAPAVQDSATAADTAAGLAAGGAAAAADPSTAAATGVFAAPDAAAAPGSAASDTQANTRASEALTQPGSAAAPVPDTAASAPVAKSASGAAKQKAASPFEDAVACARAILVGQITAVQPGSSAGRVKVTLLVTSWIAPSSGPALVTYEVAGPNAVTPTGEEKLTVGQRRLFVFPAKLSAQAYAYPDSSESRDKIAAVRAERSGEDCQ